MTITYTDIFCGAGGSSIGLTEAGLQLRLAANHWDRAIETHSTNFPDAEHLRAQRFPDSYVVTGNKGEQTKQAGNAVSSNVAHWLGTKALEALS
jgi:site-specific DNA-cytosine methylase